MLSSLLVVALAVAPVAPPGTQQAIVIPSPKKGLPSLRAFLDRTSYFSPAAAPGPLGLQLGSAISVDVFDVSACEAAGIDTDAPMTLATKGPDTVLVVGVKDAKKLTARAHSGLGAGGTVASTKIKKGELWEAHHPGNGGPELAGAFGIRGKWAALLIRGEDSRWLVAALDAKPLPGLDHAKGLTGEVWILSESGGSMSALLSLAPSATELGIDGRLWSATGMTKLPARDAFAAFHPAALAWAHVDTSGWALKESKAELAGWTRFLVLQVCRDCAVKPEEQLAATLAGPVAIAALRLAPEQSHSDHDLDRYFLVPEVEAAQVGDPVAAHTALGALLDDLRTHQAGADAVTLPRGEHYRLRLGKQRALYFGLVGSVLYLANGEDARDLFLASIPEMPAVPTNAGTLHLDGAGFGRALSKISIFDVAASTDLAALFGVAVEAAPLLKAMGDVDVTLEAEGNALRLRGSLHLPPAVPAKAP